jgi:Rrf2 family nitric oxide-sensitive transcriptional repressor
MQLTRFTDYALRVLLFVGKRDGQVCTMREIARFYRISLEHLRKVVADLLGDKAMRHQFRGIDIEISDRR